MQLLFWISRNLDYVNWFIIFFNFVYNMLYCLKDIKSDEVQLSTYECMAYIRQEYLFFLSYKYIEIYWIRFIGIIWGLFIFIFDIVFGFFVYFLRLLSIFIENFEIFITIIRFHSWIIFYKLLNKSKWELRKLVNNIFTPCL